MRLHSLEITAFGPFAEHTAVDFDDLSAANVFLLCGDTGAGKSTVLDAVCFALYGDVPSERGAARQLRSQHAAEGVAPRVVLETSVSGRRLRFTRSPGWRRPKRRGTGLTTQQPSVLVEEHVDGAWVARTTRLDEAGHLVGDLLGMNLDQFSQVVLLPQGRFDTFLRSSSEDRQRLLTQLFRTRRFEDVERWLVDRRTTLRRASDARRQGVSALLHRLSESGDVDLPDWDTDHGLDLAAGEGEVATWAQTLLASAHDESLAADADLTAVASALEAAVEAHDTGRRCADLRVQHETAARTLARAAVEADAAQADRQRLDAARRAAPVVPLAGVARRTSAAADAARTRASTALRAVDGLLDEATDLPRQVSRQAEQAAVRAALVREFVPRARELDQVTAELTRTEERITGHAERRAATVAWLETAPSATAERHERVRALEGTGEVASHQAEVARLAKRLSRFAVADELAYQVADAERRRDEQHRVTLELREHLHDLRERRLAGMAAELASRMAVGADCPVCGSHDHPHPASVVPGAPTKDDETAQRRLIDGAEVELIALDDTARSYRERLVVVRAELGDDTAERTEAALLEARAALTSAESAGRELPVARAALADHQQQVEERFAEVARLDVDLATDRERAVAARQRSEALGAELADLLGDTGLDLAALAEQSERAARSLAEARDALAAQASAESAEHDADAELAATARAQGFSGPDAAVAAALDDSAVAVLASRVETRDRVVAEAERVLADEAVRAAAERDAPDLVALATAQDRATRDHGAAVAAVRLVRQRLDRLTARVAELVTALAAWEPVRAEHARVRALSELAEGRGPDNPLQVRLSAYVLAARLTQVVAAANERLVRMYDDRFLLEHTADRGVGERRGGLSLVVRDQWTDEVRDPVTLSGGETFVVSLALALGLADVVTAEAGGTRVDTLFVDEGFGSLDADTLELVMDTLDQLREGGRVVGVVSHVAEMRSRIPAQLVVSKGRAGSRVEQRLGVG